MITTLGFFFYLVHGSMIKTCVCSNVSLRYVGLMRHEHYKGLRKEQVTLLSFFCVAPMLKCWSNHTPINMFGKSIILLGYSIILHICYRCCKKWLVFPVWTLNWPSYSPVVKVFPHILRQNHHQIVHIVIFGRRDSWITWKNSINIFSNSTDMEPVHT